MTCGSSHKNNQMEIVNMKNVIVKITRNKINNLKNSTEEKVCLLEYQFEYSQKITEKEKNATINQEIRRIEIKVLISN